MFDDLISYWKEIDFNLTDRVLIHPKEDTKKLKVKTKKEQFELKTNLFPEPFCGNLLKPKIVFLYLNPGFHKNDEKIQPNIKTDVEKTLKQNWSDKDYPFYWLKPEYDDANKGKSKDAAVFPGAYYWNRLFNQTGHSFIQRLAKECGENVKTTREKLAKSICSIELFPYHSEKFYRSLAKSDSSKIAKDSVITAIKDSTETIFVFMRSFNLWIPEDKRDEIMRKDNVIVNKAVQNPSLNPDLHNGDCLGNFLINHLKSLI